MLVIRRRPGESILLGDDIEVEVLETTPSQVKLGIRAPRSVVVIRNEIRLTEQENRAAAQADTSEQALERVRRRLKPDAPTLAGIISLGHRDPHR